jgi:translation initiation factor IF-3
VLKNYSQIIFYSYLGFLACRYNIDTHDYDVRLRAAQRFLKDGDKVKVVCQFKGREMEFKDLAFKLFERFVSDIGELGVIESKMAIEGRSMQMLIGPNKILQQKVQAQAQSVSDKIASV